MEAESAVTVPGIKGQMFRRGCLILLSKAQTAELGTNENHERLVGYSEVIRMDVHSLSPGMGSSAERCVSFASRFLPRS